MPSHNSWKTLPDAGPTSQIDQVSVRCHSGCQKINTWMCRCCCCHRAAFEVPSQLFSRGWRSTGLGTSVKTNTRRLLTIGGLVSGPTSSEADTSFFYVCYVGRSILKRIAAHIIVPEIHFYYTWSREREPRVQLCTECIERLRTKWKTSIHNNADEVKRKGCL